MGYKPVEAVQVKWPKAAQDRHIEDHTTGVVDGQLKVLTMIGIAVIAHNLEPWGKPPSLPLEPSGSPASSHRRLGFGSVPGVFCVGPLFLHAL